ncbi:uncharacterized protein EAF01_006354 [Botrytis porri]|uniref:uncharacterized protein n=1 Tax=Botrytis porri TaxID=87229 RepID=UPI00190033B0|nr:uncharacterized protein EAF01_006354 [Botrytis porri]KAF7903305.1 hypothetical protein EAF01_006354 [Botrytis porri]
MTCRHFQSPRYPIDDERFLVVFGTLDTLKFFTNTRPLNIKGRWSDGLPSFWSPKDPNDT